MARKHLGSTHDYRETSLSKPTPTDGNGSAHADKIGVPSLLPSSIDDDRFETPAAQTLREIEKALGQDAHLLRELPIIRLVMRCKPGRSSENLLDHYIDLGSIVETNAASEELRGEQVEENINRIGMFLRPAKSESGSPALNISYVEDMAHGLDKKDLCGCKWSSGPHGFVKTWSGDKYTAVAKYYFLKHPEASKELDIKFPISKTFISQLRAACLDYKTANNPGSGIHANASQRGQMLAKKTGTGRAATKPLVSILKKDEDISASHGGTLYHQQQQSSGVDISPHLDAPETPRTDQAPSLVDEPTPHRTSQRLAGRMRATPRFKTPSALGRPAQTRAPPTTNTPSPAPALGPARPSAGTGPPHHLKQFTEYLTFTLEQDDLDKSIQDDRLNIEIVDRKIQTLQAERESLKRKLSDREASQKDLSIKLKRIRQLMNADEAFELGQWVTEKRSEMKKENMN